MNVKLNNSKYTSADLWTRNSFLRNTSTIKEKIDTTPLTLSRGSTTADLANMGRPSFLRSNPKVFVADFEMNDELLQKQQGQKVHLTDNTLRSITGVNKNIQKLEKLLDNPYTLTEAGFKQLINYIETLDYPDRLELNDAIFRRGSSLASRVLNEINKINPPTIPLAPPLTSAKIEIPPSTPLAVPVPILPNKKQQKKIDKWGDSQKQLKSGQNGYFKVDELKRIGEFLGGELPEILKLNSRREPIIDYILSQAKIAPYEDAVKILNLNVLK
jgi:hypothetical protein